MPILFLAWIAALCAASWVGIGLAEAAAFAAWAPLAAGATAFVAVAAVLRRGGAAHAGALAASGWLPLLAMTLTATLHPVVDTTLASQDASIHLASGRWLARSGGLGIPDASFAPLGEDERLKLFGGASVSPLRVSLTRLPGGIVLPDTFGDVAYPSFSHLLAVWVAIADGVGGAGAVALLGPLFAATAWWALGLVVLLDAGLLAAVAAPLLLASLFPEHWFARFLMPEILGQALVWGGVAAGRLALRERFGAPPGLVAGVLCGVALGLAGFARLEQVWIFVPALLLARALLPVRIAILPRGALVPFVLVAVHAVAHVFVVPTDYANRIYKQAIGVYAEFVVLVSTLTGHDGYLTGFLLNRVIPLAALAGVAAALWLGWRIERRRPGFLPRATAAVASLPWIAALFRARLQDSFPAVRSLLLYVPWPLWGATVLGALRLPVVAGLDVALALQAVEQVVNARVSDQQPWASRRLVTVVLPLLVLFAARALGGAGGRTAAVRPRSERGVAAALVVVALAIGVQRLRPVAGRELQQGGAALVAKIASALPEPAYVIVAQPLDWVHLAPALWLGEGRTTLVARRQPWFPPALARFLALGHDRPIFVLGGAVAAPDVEIEPRRTVPPLPAGTTLEAEASFSWTTERLQTTHEQRPERIVAERARLELYRLRLPPQAR